MDTLPENEALDLCRAVCAAHGYLRLLLDHELGIRHGIDLADFMLLDRLAASPDGRAAMAALAAPLGLPRSQLVRQLLALEKTGIVQREGSAGERTVVLRGPGRTMVTLARETAASLCAARAQAPALAALHGAGKLTSSAPARRTAGSGHSPV